MGMLETASHEWSSRPADERFGSLADMMAKANEFRRNARVARVDTKSLHVSVETDFDSNDPKADALILNGATGRKARLTNWAFNQLCARAEAPAGFVGGLSADTAARCLNEGFAKRPDAKALLLIYTPDVNGGAHTMRAITSTRYARIWNTDIIARLQELEARGTWQPAPAAFDGSRGLYMGDRDMFAFMVDNSRRIFETLPGGGLSRGFFARNSEVGGASYDVLTFLYEYVCGNHRVWGVQGVKELKLRHVGKNADRAVTEWNVAFKEYGEASEAEDVAKITAAREMVIAGTKDEILDKIFGLKTGATRKQLEAGYAKAVEREDWYGNPHSVWGFAGGLTEVARDMPNADDRYTLDNAGRKVMEMAF